MRRARILRSSGAALVAAAITVSGCSTGSPVALGAGSGPVQVVAAENFWGSIAGQLGGRQVAVTSIIDNPATDPHDYEPTAVDARAVATAALVVVNGIGYDPWATKLVQANPSSDQKVLTVGKVVGVPDGGNPHRWYSPPDVAAVADAITTAYKRIDPAHAAYFDGRRRAFDDRALAEYHHLAATIRARYGGTPIGASESIVTPLAEALGLRLITPPAFLKAISEGTDPAAGDKSTIDRQISGREIKVYVYNSQNATPDVRSQVAAARAAGIPVTSVTETLTPAGASFQAWQVRQLTALEAALAKGSRR